MTAATFAAGFIVGVSVGLSGLILLLAIAVAARDRRRPRQPRVLRVDLGDEAIRTAVDDWRGQR